MATIFESMDYTAGYLEVILGPMFSGKTSRLLEIYRKYEGIVGKKVVVINHYTDNRYGENTELYTHSKDKIPCLPLKQLKEYESIFFVDKDEGDFLGCNVIKEGLIRLFLNAFPFENRINQQCVFFLASCFKIHTSKVNHVRQRKARFKTIGIENSNDLQS